MDESLRGAMASLVGAGFAFGLGRWVDRHADHEADFARDLRRLEAGYQLGVDLLGALEGDDAATRRLDADAERVVAAILGSKHTGN